MSNSLICPVCGNAMHSTICSKCGYTHFLFPKELPPQVEKFEQTRIRIMRNCRKKNFIDRKNSNTIINDKKAIVGTLLIRKLMTEAIHAYPIKEGRNIYGTIQSNNSTKIFINPLEIGADIPEIIFGIEASNNELKLIPHKEFELSHNRYLVQRIMNLDNEDYFFHSNILSFHAILF